MDNLDRFDTLVDIIARLRAPDGCPWDRKQDHQSLRENLLEECYEVLDALDEGSPAKLSSELGDLLMQIVFHIQIATEAGDFTLADVAKGINSKLVRRHPHIFGNAKAETAEEVAHNWEQLKRAERAEGASILESLPRSMPALSYSQSIQRRVAQVGFDWENIQGVIDKLSEEVEEFRRAPDPAEKEKEFGDLLLTLVNVGRRLGIDSESALRGANERFRSRFARMEEICRERGVNIGDLSLAEQDKLWEAAKGEEFE